MKRTRLLIVSLVLMLSLSMPVSAVAQSVPVRAQAVSHSTLTVSPSKIILNKKAAIIMKGSKIKLTATLSPKGAKRSLKWSSSNKKAATVTQAGVVNGVAPGKATITVKTYNGKIAKCTVTVKARPSKVTLSTVALTMNPGNSSALKATIAPSGAYNVLKWSSTNKNVATVSSKGVVTAVAPGTAKITVKTANGKTASCGVTVKSILTDETDLKKGANASILSCYILNRYKGGNAPQYIADSNGYTIAKAGYASNGSLSSVETYSLNVPISFNGIRFASLVSASTQSVDKALTVRASVAAGTYDFAADPDGLLAIYMKSFSVGGSVLDLDAFKKITNQSTVNQVDFDKIKAFANQITNIQQVIIYGKTSGGSVAAKYIGFMFGNSINENMAYICINPENPDYLKTGVITK